VAIAGVRPLVLSGFVDLASNQVTMGDGGAICTVTAIAGAAKAVSASKGAVCALAAAATSSPFMMELLLDAIVTVRLNLRRAVGFMKCIPLIRYRTGEIFEESIA
jgi:hypothetical protein